MNAIDCADVQTEAYIFDEGRFLGYNGAVLPRQHNQSRAYRCSLRRHGNSQFMRGVLHLCGPW